MNSGNKVNSAQKTDMILNLHLLDSSSVYQVSTMYKAQSWVRVCEEQRRVTYNPLGEHQETQTGQVIQHKANISISSRRDVSAGKIYQEKGGSIFWKLIGTFVPSSHTPTC